ncbi:PREDICTED: speedy protein E3 [Propithecus coquereli]|uniref:Speedy/RINGO cell cycle regulator family member E4 n=1 Tax=Propithecus coquereli TaxID=379532 RepID=A0A2K6GIM5_PROCO|nr:PREDICTED: speedy protein E3 [Propithecus coquereli]
MAIYQPDSWSEDHSPQPSMSGYYPLEVVRDDEHPGPSAPREDPSPLSRSPGQKRKRECSTDSENEELEEELVGPEPKDIWVVESLRGLKTRLKKQRVSSVLPEHHRVFTRLLEDPVIRNFLAWDKNLRVSDKYLLAMVIAYFSRAGLFSWQYRRIHFFIALYLANDMEEDSQTPKKNIFSFLYGESRSQRPLFHKLRYQFVQSMGWRTRVSREECEEIQAYDPDLWVWGRDRTLLPYSSRHCGGPRSST